MATDFGRALERSPEGYHALAWLLYVASGLIGLATLGEVSGTLLLVGCIIIIFLARSRRNDANQTIYASHFSRIARVMTASLVVALLLLAITIGTFGIGIIITWPLYVIFLVYLAIKLVRGMMKLNDRQAV
jgi:uncharacterized membrane protein